MTKIIWHNATVTTKHRNHKNNHKSVILWFTGLSGSGKSTLAHAIEKKLYQQGCRTFVLDGDNVRHGLSSDLGFSELDRKENIRRIGEVAKLMMEAGIITLAAFISPYRKDRELARNLVPHGDFIEVYCKAKLATCEIRDVKGLYKKVRSGEIENYTGIDSPYEHPLKPEIVIDTDSLSLDESVKLIMQLLNQQSIVKL
jgi:adenylylsulfate kinase